MVDFKKLYGVFVDEAMERLTELEEGLLRLEKSPDDKDLINTIFRAAHTIKGSSGTIGLKDISRFTHIMEEILDMVRQDKIPPIPPLEKGGEGGFKDLINVLLEAADVIKEMVGCVASETAFDFSRCTDLIKRMEDIKVQSLELRVKSSETEKEEEAELQAQNSKLKIYRIVFAPAKDLFKRGIDPSIIIDDLKGIGEVVSIKGCTDAVPVLSEMNPENLYLRWDIQLKTDRNEEDIRKAFEFVEEGSEIKILPVTTPEKDTPFIGKLLVGEDIVKAEDVEEALKSQKRLGNILVEQGKVSHGEVDKVLEKQRGMKVESFKNSISSTIRVDLKKLDHLINIVGEMVIVHSMFQQIIRSNGQGNGGNATAERLDVLLSQLQKIGSDIQKSAMSLRMLPVGEVFQRFTRLVRELSVSKDKSIELIITGEETELDKGVLEKIADPLVHLIRNSIDHGIETPEERLSKGKTEKGSIHLSAYQMGDSVYIEVEDDGRGLNKEKIIGKAVSRGIINNAAGLTDEQICNLIFLPGFSTADKVTDVSGRGVGMDVVKKNIESLNGRVYINTKQDIGTTISIKLPLTLAIIDGLTVVIGEDVFVIPISSVVELLCPDKKDIKTLEEKAEVINVRGEYIPLLRLNGLLGIASWKKDPWDAIVVVTVHEGKKYCLMVDDLIGQQQIVIKNLGNATPRIRDIAGGTILGDGKVALVLDVPGIVEMATR
jgi:two-component system chemotaxis sensor kinase CheA